MNFKHYLEGEVKHGFLTERAAKCLLTEACRILGIKEYQGSKLKIVAGVIFVDKGGEESVELGELLYKCGGRTGG